MFKPKLADDILILLIENEGVDATDMSEKLSENLDLVLYTLDQIIKRKPGMLLSTGRMLHESSHIILGNAYEARVFINGGGFISEYEKSLLEYKAEEDFRAVEIRTMKETIRNARNANWIALAATIISVIALIVALKNKT